MFDAQLRSFLYASPIGCIAHDSIKCLADFWGARGRGLSLRLQSAPASAPEEPEVPVARSSE